MFELFANILHYSFITCNLWFVMWAIISLIKDFNNDKDDYIEIFFIISHLYIILFTLL